MKKAVCGITAVNQPLMLKVSGQLLLATKYVVFDDGTKDVTLLALGSAWEGQEITLSATVEFEGLAGRILSPGGVSEMTFEAAGDGPAVLGCSVAASL